MHNLISILNHFNLPNTQIDLSLKRDILVLKVVDFNLKTCYS